MPFQRISELAVSLLAAVVLLYLAIHYERYRWLKRQALITLEVVPLADSNLGLEATDQLFQVLHSLRRSRKLRDRLFGHQTRLSLELVATKQTGIRYIVKVPKSLVNQVEQQLHAHLPSTKLSQIIDPSAGVDYSRIQSYRLRHHFAFPLAPFVDLESKDPMSYLTGALTKLTDDEQAVFQLVITPLVSTEAVALARQLLINGNLIDQLSKKQLPIFSIMSQSISNLLSAILDLLSTSVISGKPQSPSYAQRSQYDQQQIARRLKPARQVSYFEQQILGSMQSKLSKPLFAVTIRASVRAYKPQPRLQAITAGLEAYHVPTYQELHRRRRSRLSQRFLQKAFHNALPAIRRRYNVLLSSTELAMLYHFPTSPEATAENIVQTLSKTLPAPVSLKSAKPLDVILGVNQYHGVETPIGLTTAERERHVYMIGGTGNGKTTMLQYAIVQDITAGKGVAVVDPHGDMAETLLTHIPKNRIEDVIYFNPDDISRPIGLNLLELASELTGDELLKEKDLITESVVSVFRKIFSEEDSGGHRIEYVLRNAIQTALTVPDATLFTVFDLLNDPKYRQRIVKTLDNPDLVNFWRHEIGEAGDMQRVKMAAGITSKIGRFLFSGSARRILEQPQSTIDFDAVINDGKILICNLSKGLIGEDTSELFGITVLAKLQLASLRRARQLQADRAPFYLYVDEFQNFATPSFVQMLSESRKYKLYLTMAEQTTAQQQDQKIVQIILANVGTLIVFRTGSSLDEQLLLPLFEPYIAPKELANLPSYCFYARLAATTAQEPLSGMTLLLETEGNSDIAMCVKNYSRETYGREPKPAVKIPPKIETTVKQKDQQMTKQPIKTTSAVAG